MIAQMHFVGIATREQVVHVVVHAAFAEFCRNISPPSSPVTTTGLVVESHSIVAPPIGRATGFHFGPIGTCCWTGSLFGGSIAKEAQLSLILLIPHLLLHVHSLLY
jgi:hypothetical protein